jgi:hypothetical protein
MHGKRGREDAGDDQNFSAVEEWRAAAELKCLSADAKSTGAMASLASARLKC